jgi:hypothetical protein
MIAIFYREKKKTFYLYIWSIVTMVYHIKKLDLKSIENQIPFANVML